MTLLIKYTQPFRGLTPSIKYNWRLIELKDATIVFLDIAHMPQVNRLSNRSRGIEMWILALSSTVLKKASSVGEGLAANPEHRLSRLDRNLVNSLFDSNKCSA